MEAGSPQGSEINQWKTDFVPYVNLMKLRINATFSNCSLYNDLRNDWIRNITDKTPDFVDMDTTTKFKGMFAIHHSITAKFILRAYNVRKENLFR